MLSEKKYRFTSLLWCCRDGIQSFRGYKQMTLSYETFRHRKNRKKDVKPIPTIEMNDIHVINQCQSFIKNAWEHHMELHVRDGGIFFCFDLIQWIGKHQKYHMELKIKSWIMTINYGASCLNSTRIWSFLQNPTHTQSEKS